MPSPQPSDSSFSELSLLPALIQALEDVGYETPTPIQAQTIPPLLEGKDLLGHAPTGTGKTAAFALPLLSRLDPERQGVQIMVLTPTRELAIQVAEAFRRYASYLKNFHVLPVYGGQDYTGQIRQLKRGVNVVVGTPGRVMDHMRRGTLKLDKLQALVLDEADEMLRMGFIDDIQWILEQTPQDRQLALFSATMPNQIQRIARRHLNDPTEVTIKTQTATADTIQQRYWLVSGLHKLDALTRILETEPFDAMLIFVRTRLATAELAERLEARGHAAAALNGDVPQKQREAIVERLKRGSLDLLIATDVAARGLDVERISHVINYDIPYDTEAYIHRIGRTGRAGRSGDAILFVTPREKRMLHAIEKATRHKIEPLTLPTTEMVNNRRIAAFHQSINNAIATGRHEFMQNLLQQYQQEHEVPAIEIAAALATLYLGDKELLLNPEQKPKREHKNNSVTSDRKKDKKRQEQSSTSTGFRVIATPEHTAANRPNESKTNRKTKSEKSKYNAGANARPQTRSDHSVPPAENGMEWFRLEAGKDHNVSPANVVGTIANEAGLESEYIGRIKIESDHSLVELPLGMPKAILRDLRKAWICGQRMGMSRLDSTFSAKENRPKKNQKNKSDRGAEQRHGTRLDVKSKSPKKKHKNRGEKSAQKPHKKQFDSSTAGKNKKAKPGRKKRTEDVTV
ncbi:MAG: DEAD/DEAH box helicase [Gammaproteobacteria bacterium]|nr:DEAD/DEAH box helicase [Gammaproteobacteria bacterium]